MQIAYTGDEALLTIGTGPDHGMIDISINDWFWRSFNTYTAQPGERVLHIPQVTTPTGETTGTLEIRNRSDRHHRSTGHVFRFKQLAVIDTTYTDTTIDYTYDALSRLLTANYDGGAVEYTYGYDLAGNLTNNNGKTRTYNATNQLTNDGTHTLTYDANGNLTNDGTNTYTWDRANRMLTAPNNTSYKYDGLGNRIQQTANRVVTNYLLDLQPGLTKVLAATTGTNTDHYIHAPQGSNVPGIHVMQNNAGNWSYMAQDGLGSVRSEIDSLLKVSAAQNYAPYGETFGGVGSFDSPYGFTGEQADGNGQVYLRARYYNPSIGMFPSLDPFEGTMQRPMSLNSYSWVEGNFPNATDPSGNIPLYDDVESGRTLYSCKCGWIDFGHALPWKALAVIDAINYPIDWNSHPDVLPDIRVIRLRDYANAVVTDLLSTDSYYINDRRIESWYDVRGVALRNSKHPKSVKSNCWTHWEGSIWIC